MKRLRERIRKLRRRLRVFRRRVERIRAMRRFNVNRAALVEREARRAKLRPWHAVALLEKETGIPQKNIFGCDHGPGKAFCHKEVRKGRVRRLLDGPYANGVGWTQLTYKPFVRAANRMGGAHKPKYQMRVGFRLLSDLIKQHGVETGFARYNGSGPKAAAYGKDAVIRSQVWHRRLS